MQVFKNLSLLVVGIVVLIASPSKSCHLTTQSEKDRQIGFKPLFEKDAVNARSWEYTDHKDLQLSVAFYQRKLYKKGAPRVFAKGSSRSEQFLFLILKKNGTFLYITSDPLDDESCFLDGVQIFEDEIDHAYWSPLKPRN